MASMTRDRMRLLAQRQYPGYDEEEIEDVVDEWLSDYREAYANGGFDHDDTPCVQNCDDYGTGEGQFHGRI